MQASVVQTGWLHGFKVVAVAVVAQAIWTMAKTLCPDWTRRVIALMTALLVLVWTGIGGQLAAISGGAVLGLWLLRPEGRTDHEPHLFTPGKKTAILCLGLFIGLLLALSLLTRSASHALALVDSFYRAGSLVFGGGHVVLLLLKAEVVTRGWISQDLFLAGYGEAQAVPGPLFTFSAYLGTAQRLAPNGWSGGLICLLSIFLPSFLLLTGVLPFWNGLRRNQRIRSALNGINAVVIGLLIAAFYDPIRSSGILSAADLILALAAFAALTWRIPPWAVVDATGAAAAAISVL